VLTLESVDRPSGYLSFAETEVAVKGRRRIVEVRGRWRTERGEVIGRRMCRRERVAAMMVIVTYGCSEGVAGNLTALQGGEIGCSSA
jgi:hypothetical protein